MLGNREDVVYHIRVKSDRSQQRVPNAFRTEEMKERRGLSPVALYYQLELVFKRMVSLVPWSELNDCSRVRYVGGQLGSVILEHADAFSMIITPCFASGRRTVM